MFCQPVGEPMKIAGKGAKLFDIFLGAILGNGHQMENGPNINSRCVGIDPFEQFFRAFDLLLLLVVFFFAIPTPRLQMLLWTSSMLRCFLNRTVPEGIHRNG